jgi:hypothetical protein
MDSFPYVDRLWLGEGHHYDGPAAQTLVGVSGIPFGLMGEMLEGGGNPWIGITFGMTGRLGWGGDPQPVWKLWDAFGAAGSEFIGWWDKANPVKAGAPGCQATIWKKDKQTLVAIANFSDKAVKTTLAVDFAALGLDPKKAHLYAPEMKGFQPELLLAVDAPVPIAPKRGFVFILDEIVRPPVKAAPALTFETAKLLFEDHFVPQPKDGWTVTASPAAGGIKADEAGLVFSAPANAHLWQEWRIPSEITQVSAQIRQDAGDTALEYGPGLALVWPDGKLLKASRRRDNRITISGGGINQLAGVTDIHLPVTLSFVFSKDAIRIVASGEGAYEQQQELASIPRSAFVGNPTGLRLGKIPNNGKPTDQKQLGLMGWNRVDWVKVYRE